MIDIILDGNVDNKFCGKEYPSVEINDFAPDDWRGYQEKARQIINDNLKNKAVIIKINNEETSLNKLALAIFTESFEDAGILEYAVFKVKNLQEAQERYKPYVALTIAVKYALVLSAETPKTIYKSISELGYLGIKTKQDYTNNTMILSLPNSSATAQKIKAENLQDVICNVAMLKALSLAQKEVNLELSVKCDETPVFINKDELVQKIICQVSPWIN